MVTPLETQTAATTPTATTTPAATTAPSATITPDALTAPTAPFGFLSDEPKVGDPPRSDWAAFKRPQLRRYPDPKGLRLRDILGRGSQGIVWRARTREGRQVAVKIFRRDRKLKLAPGKYHVIWPLERESVNGAILELVTTRLRRAKESGQAVYIRPDPQTYAHAIRNLKAFSDEGAVDAEHPPKPGFVPFRPDDVDINECLGWAELDRRVVAAAFKQCNDIPPPVERYYCIVYGLVADQNLEAAKVLGNGDFFHTIGFYNENFNVHNWRGKGVLVDYADIVPPLGCHGFNEHSYGRMWARAKETILNLEKAGQLKSPWTPFGPRYRQKAQSIAAQSRRRTWKGDKELWEEIAKPVEK